MFCHSDCGMLVEVEDGIVVEVRANPGCKISPGTICVKATAAIESHYHSDRLNHPLKRVGERS